MQSHVMAGLKTCSRGEMKGEIRKRSQEGDEAEKGEDSDAQAAGVSGYLPSAPLTIYFAKYFAPGPVFAAFFSTSASCFPLKKSPF